MMMRRQTGLLALLLLVCWLPAQAIITGELIMVRSDKTFPEAMLILQDAIKTQGYTLSRVQRVDIGLTMSGYPTDKYRIVFFGKTEQIHELTKKHPELIPYLPLKIAIFAEADETLLVTSDPAIFMDLYPDPRLHEVFHQWHEDIVNIMKKVQIPD
ncbi:MAG: DUF302 domain-containing protein [Gammaproteobacteria bacterium]|nr:DUF302 domain-containing protein [Gammaproteobacteria bacterium]MDH5735026.1 DUF302 domain-containing protein [Gammaproteobacteria bacterium]